MRGSGAGLLVQLAPAAAICTALSGHGQGELGGVVARAGVTDAATDACLAVAGLGVLHEQAALVKVDHVVGGDVGNAAGVRQVLERPPLDDVGGQKSVERRTTFEAHGVDGHGQVPRALGAGFALADGRVGPMRDDGLGVGPPPRVLGGDHGERRAGGGTLNADEVATAWPVLPRWAAAGSTQQCLARGSRRWVPVPAWNDGIVASTPLRRARAAT